MTATSAPIFNSVNALTGDVAQRPSKFWEANADQDVRLAEVDKTVRDLEALRDENAELRIRVNELDEELGIWRDECLRWRSGANSGADQ